MRITFPWLWLIWFIGLVYDVIVSTVGIFPGRTLADRLTEDAGIAWFIFSAWSLMWLVNLSYKIERRVTAKKQRPSVSGDDHQDHEAYP